MFNLRLGKGFKSCKIKPKDFKLCSRFKKLLNGYGNSLIYATSCRVTMAAKKNMSTLEKNEI